MSHLPIPLFHGTSTLFLDSIIESGLGGINPIQKWRILEFAKVIHPLVQEHIAKDKGFMMKAKTFDLMVEQASHFMNFQHGETYLSPVSDTAIRYAVNKRVGSELLSYTLDFLQVLVCRNVSGVSSDLYHRYPEIFNLLDISVAPLLIEVSSVPVADLLTEDGGDPESTLDYIQKTLQDDKEFSKVLLQQANFRLKSPVPVSALKISLINVTQFDLVRPEYTLFEIPATKGQRVDVE